MTSVILTAMLIGTAQANVRAIPPMSFSIQTVGPVAVVVPGATRVSGLAAAQMPGINSLIYGGNINLQGLAKAGDRRVIVLPQAIAKIEKGSRVTMTASSRGENPKVLTIGKGLAGAVKRALGDAEYGKAYSLLAERFDRASSNDRAVSEIPLLEILNPFPPRETKPGPIQGRRGPAPSHGLPPLERDVQLSDSEAVIQWASGTQQRQAEGVLRSVGVETSAWEHRRFGRPVDLAAKVTLPGIDLRRSSIVPTLRGLSDVISIRVSKRVASSVEKLPVPRRVKAGAAIAKLAEDELELDYDHMIVRLKDNYSRPEQVFGAVGITSARGVSVMTYDVHLPNIDLAKSDIVQRLLKSDQVSRIWVDAGNARLIRLAERDRR